MTGDILAGGVAAGDVATEALVARSVEPAAGERSPHGSSGAGAALCLNCGTARAGPFCHQCGQSDHVHRTLGAIGHDLLHGVFHFEGKFFRTLPMLVFRPGELTRRYIAGERARFVSPLALFLFSVFLMVASTGVLGPGKLSDALAGGMTAADRSLDNTAAAMTARIDRLEARRAVETSAAVRTKLTRQIAEERRGLAEMRKWRGVAQGADRKQVTGVERIDHAIDKLRTNPQLVAYKVQSSGYKYSWTLILLSTPLVALLFVWRRRFTLYDHAVFATYSITFMSLLVIWLELLLKLDLRSLFSWTLLLGPAVHIFVQLRGAYRLSVLSALWRTVFLLAFAVIALTIFVTALVALGTSG